MPDKFRQFEFVEVTFRRPDVKPKTILGTIIGPAEGQENAWRVKLHTTGIIMTFPEADINHAGPPG